MSYHSEMCCDLCRRSEETKVTGALSTEAEVTAHQNCLLFSSGIYCQNSPLSDDLFGFTIMDVRNELKRGGKLMCAHCGRKGATAGCEVKRCKKCYHYPCAIEDGAKCFENPEKGKYGLHCSKHVPQGAETTGLVMGVDSSSTTTGPLKSPDRAGKSMKRQHADSSTSARSISDSARTTHPPCKRLLHFSHKQEARPCKKSLFGGGTNQISDDSSNSDEGEPHADFAPIEPDSEESAPPGSEPQFIRNDEKTPTSGNLEEETSSSSRSRNKTETVHSDAESESLLPPFKISKDTCKSPSTRSLSSPTLSTAHPNQITVEAVVNTRREAFTPIHCPDQLTAGPSETPPSTDSAKSNHVNGLNISQAPPACLYPCPAPPYESEPTINALGFWKSCNASGCTQAIFADFSNEISGISRRIQAEQASQEDYDLALRVMSASGKLKEYVAKQQKELEQKQMELKKAEASLKKAISALDQL